MATGTVTKLQICNLALSMIGSKRITSAELTTPVSQESKRIEDSYAYALDQVLSEHPWTFAQKRMNLAKVITGITAANPPVVTSVAHGFSDEDEVIITSVDGMTEVNGETYFVASKTADTFELQSAVGTDVDGSGYTAYTENGYITKLSDLSMDDDESTYQYTLPTDFIRVNILSNRDAYWTVEAGYIYSDTNSLKMIYTYRNEDPTLYSSQFVTALATKIASEICFSLTQSANRTKDLVAKYENIDLPRAMGADSSQGSPEELEMSEWEEARL